MKGQISKQLERILQNPTTRAQLLEALLDNKPTVTFGTNKYKIVRTTPINPTNAEAVDQSVVISKVE
jgi:hypothetical protein